MIDLVSAPSFILMIEKSPGRLNRRAAEFGWRNPRRVESRDLPNLAIRIDIKNSISIRISRFCDYDPVIVLKSN